MFSATISSSVEELARTVLGVDLLRVIVGHKCVSLAPHDNSYSSLKSLRF